MVADGAFVLDLADFDLTIGPGTGPNLLTVGSATGTFPDLGDLAITVTGFVLSKDGVFGAGSVVVASHGFAESIGLGGVLPFDVTSVTVVFPDRTNLDSFEVRVVGSVRLRRLPHDRGLHAATRTRRGGRDARTRRRS